jgi:hypothetical protein
MTNEAFARLKIDALPSAQGWDTLDTNAVRVEILDIQTAKHSLQRRAQMGVFSGRDPAKRLSQEGAAEHLWSMLIAPLQWT